MTRTQGTRSLRDRCHEILRLIDETLDTVPSSKMAALPG